MAIFGLQFVSQVDLLQGFILQTCRPVQSTHGIMFSFVNEAWIMFSGQAFLYTALEAFFIEILERHVANIIWKR